MKNIFKLFGIKKSILFLIVFFTGILFWTACTIQQKHVAKKMQYVFIDGAPNPNDSVKLITTTSDSVLNQNQKNKIVIPTIYSHVPYSEKQCNDCHSKTSRLKLNTPQPDLCFTCHDDFQNTFVVIHGPADGGFCTKCHNPHKSKIEKLLVKKGQSLCLDCHELSDVKKNDVHADIQETSCTECHNPHGGSDKYLLR